MIVLSLSKFWQKPNQVILNFRLKILFKLLQEFCSFVFCLYVCKTLLFKSLDDIFKTFFISCDIHISELAFCSLLYIICFLKVCSCLYQDLEYIQKVLSIEALFSGDILLFEKLHKT